MEIYKFLFGYRSVEISGFFFIIMRFEIDFVYIDSIDIDNRCCCIVEIEIIVIIKSMNFFS